MALHYPRHIQNMSEAQELQHHWGYADRALPCTNDAGSCEYLDVVYHSHDLGIMYSGILWATILGVLFIWGLGRLIFVPTCSQQTQTVVNQGTVQKGHVKSDLPSDRKSLRARLLSSVAATQRHYLLPEVPIFARCVFSHTTRLQALILAVLAGYLLIWSFVGITFRTWITPVKNMPGTYNTRTSLGPWADRVGILAYALTPLSVLLSSRESLLSLITGLSYQNFNFLHRWLGYIIFLQSGLHTVGWCVVEIRLYQPQPTVGLAWINQTYMIWGVIAMFLLTILFLLSMPFMIRRTGYEFFRKSHYVLAMLYVGACWGHWSKLACWMIASLVVWLIDRCIRAIRTFLLHYNFNRAGMMALKSSEASFRLFENHDDGDVIRLDFTHPQDAWHIGQHFYLCFPRGSIWQSHPFTPLSLPKAAGGEQLHSYVFRVKKGETKRIAHIGAAEHAASSGCQSSADTARMTTPIILTGPYGTSVVKDITLNTNILCVAGGTGITYTLPILLDLVSLRPINNDRKIDLIWAVRRNADVEWIRPELEILNQAASSHGIVIKIFITREVSQKFSSKSRLENETSSSSTSSASASTENFEKYSEPVRSSIAVTRLSPSSLDSASKSTHPNLRTIVNQFVRNTVHGPTIVYASGPGSMIADLRRAVASCNAGRKVWKGEDRYSVSLKCDDRLEW